MYWGKGTPVTRPLVMGSHHTFYSSVIRLQSFSGLGTSQVLLGNPCAHFHHLIVRTGRLQWAEVGYFPFPGQLYSDKTPAG